MYASSRIGRLSRACSFLLSIAGAFVTLTACAGAASADTCHCTCHCPEIDAGSLASAATLVTGGLLVLADRLRRK